MGEHGRVQPALRGLPRRGAEMPVPGFHGKVHATRESKAC